MHKPMILFAAYELSATCSLQSKDLPQDPIVTEVHVPGSNWTLEVAPVKGWVPGWRPWVLAVVVIVSCLIGLLLAAILVSARLQTWLKVG
jgi:hypothetical protein